MQPCWGRASGIPGANGAGVPLALVHATGSRTPLAGIEPLDIHRLTSVVTDFLSNLLILERRSHTDLSDAAVSLEQESLGGDVTIEAGKLEYPEIYYEPSAGRFPLHRTSSMVSELAPVVLFLKHIIRSGDFLIIEEPESHLHPDNQRKLARVLVRLVRKNVSILITTHSDYFLAQLSNFIRLSQIPEDKRVEQGYTSNEFLDPTEVATYLFSYAGANSGSSIRELPITASEGIPEEDFATVAEALYQETVRLDRQINPPEPVDASA